MVGRDRPLYARIRYTILLSYIAMLRFLCTPTGLPRQASLYNPLPASITASQSRHVPKKNERCMHILNIAYPLQTYGMEMIGGYGRRRRCERANAADPSLLQSCSICRSAGTEYTRPYYVRTYSFAYIHTRHAIPTSVLRVSSARRSATCDSSFSRILPALVAPA